MDIDITTSDLSRINEVLKNYDKDQRKGINFLFHDLKSQINDSLIANINSKPS